MWFNGLLGQALALLVKSVHVWQPQSEKRQVAQPKQTQEVQPVHVEAREQPLYTLRLALSSSSSQVILKQRGETVMIVSLDCHFNWAHKTCVEYKYKIL